MSIRIVLWALLIAVGLSACGFPRGAIVSSGDLYLPKGGCGKPVCGKQRYTVHSTVNAVEVSFTNSTSVTVHVTFQAPHQFQDLGHVPALGTIHFTYIPPALYRGSTLKVFFLVQALDREGSPLAVKTVRERIRRNDQVLVSGVVRMRLPQGLR